MVTKLDKAVTQHEEHLLKKLHNPSIIWFQGRMQVAANAANAAPQNG